MTALAGGLIALILGIIGIIFWWGYFLQLLMGGVPVMLILVMVFRPTGLVAFREFDVKTLVEPKMRKKSEVANAVASR